MAVLQLSMIVRSYSSLPTLQGRVDVESIGTTRIRHTQAFRMQSALLYFNPLLYGLSQSDD